MTIFGILAILPIPGEIAMQKHISDAIRQRDSESLWPTLPPSSGF
jgi:hypothetical protein